MATKCCKQKGIFIAHILPRLEIGGAQKIALEVMRASRNNNIQCIAIGIDGECGSIAKELTKIGIDTFIHKVLLPRSVLIPTRFRNTIRIPYVNYRIFCLVKKLQYKGITGIHLHITHYPAVVSTITACIKEGLSFYWTLHGEINYSPIQLENIVKLVRNLEHSGLNFQIIQLNRRLNYNFTKKLEMSNVSVKFICNGVDLDCSSLNVNRTLLRKSIGVSGQTILIGSIGRLKAIKGYDVLIEALLKIRCSKHVSVILIGSGEDQQKLQTQVNESGLRDRVYFLGEQQNPKELISNVDLYIQPSRSEGIPISVLEAMACGLPIIATDVGGVADILGDGKFGVLVPPNNPNELALAIENLCNDDQLRRHFSIMSLERVQEFSLSKMCNEYLEVYQKEGW